MTSDAPEITLAGLGEALLELPTIPETLTRILELLEDPNSGARDLAAVIRSDAPLAAKILRLANSPLYQKNRSITTVQECVAVLGYRTVRQVALCVAVVSSLGKECDARAAALDYRDLWRHCVTVGAVSQELARAVRHESPETVFTGGLLHDLGKFVLTICHPRHYADLVVARRRSGLPLVEAERRDLGFDHAQAGGALARSWNFPDVLIAMIAGHHDREPSDRSVALVGLADHLANIMAPTRSDLGFSGNEDDADALYSQAGITRYQVEDLTEQLEQAIAAVEPLASLD
ncbi:HDOD domain-containing protein [bacterium]|nr:HDOD domain-containing protein [bacterium]